MAIVEIKIDTMERFADGQAFGEAGSYLRIKGIAKGEIDPAAPENRVITDLDKAPRNAQGTVEYETDFFILRPVDPRRASGVLVYDVTNRGRKMILNLLDDAASDADTNDPKTARDVGLGFTLGRGYSLVWSGWDSGAPRANNGMTDRHAHRRGDYRDGGTDRLDAIGLALAAQAEIPRVLEGLRQTIYATAENTFTHYNAL